MQRWQQKYIAQDLKRKMVFVTGPRQVGKTTLAKSLKEKWPDLEYLNYDAEKDKLIIHRQEWNRQAPLVLFDEIHKQKRWKSKLKGIYDTEGIPPRILVTGSARLDTYRRGGDSLAGRYFLHRLYPLSVRELKDFDKPQKILEQLLRLGGFPEPFLMQSETEARRWRQQHVERIIREDIQDLEPVRDIQALLLLVSLLRERVGSPISYASLARDIEVSPHTVKRWITTLENMYLLFRITPYHRNIARAVLKEPKVYFYDTGYVEGNDGQRFENQIAVSLRKWLHFLEDTQGHHRQLHYLRDKEKREVDFVIADNKKVIQLIEAKLSDDHVATALRYYHQQLQPEKSIQLVYNEERSKTVKGIQVAPAAKWLSKLDI